MIKIRQFINKYVVVFSIAIIIISLSILSLGKDLGHIGMDLIIRNCMGRLPSSFFLIAVMLLLGLFKNRFRLHGLLKGFVSGWALLLVGIAYFLLQLFSIDLQKTFVGANALAIIAIVFDMFCTGLFEETMMRGVVFQSMAKAWGKLKMV